MRVFFACILLIAFSIHQANCTLFLLGNLLKFKLGLLGLGRNGRKNVNVNTQQTASVQPQTTQTSISNTVNTNFVDSGSGRANLNLNSLLNTVRFVQPRQSTSSFNANGDGDFGLNTNLRRNVRNQRTTNLQGSRNDGLDGANLNIFVLNGGQPSGSSRLNGGSSSSTRLIRDNSNNALINALQGFSGDIEVNGQIISVNDFIRILTESGIFADGDNTSTEALIGALSGSRTGLLNGMRNSEIFVNGQRVSSGNFNFLNNQDDGSDFIDSRYEEGFDEGFGSP